MATTLPVMTETIDNAFTHTWYEIRKEAIDNILEANVVWAALKERGCMVTQVGGKLITRTVSYGTETTKAVKKGSTFSQGETEYETMAQWTWRYESAHVQRSVFDDQQNSGKFAIKSLVATRLKKAREALDTTYENNLLRTISTAETGDSMQGLNDLIPPYALATTGTYGKIARPASYAADAMDVLQPGGANSWWGPKYKALVLPIEVNLYDDMKTLYNSLSNNSQQPPNLIITDQSLYELFEDFADDKTQIVVDAAGSKLANLGFDVIRFKGKPMVWTSNVDISGKQQMLFVNTNNVEVVYDPQLWFEMTPWKTIPLQGERIAHILCASNMVSEQLRRHGRLYEA